MNFTSSFLDNTTTGEKVTAYSNTKRKKVKPEGNNYLQKTHHNWTKANELQRPCFKQDTKANQWWVKAM